MLIFEKNDSLNQKNGHKEKYLVNWEIRSIRRIEKTLKNSWNFTTFLQYESKEELHYIYNIIILKYLYCDSLEDFYLRPCMSNSVESHKQRSLDPKVL